MKIDYFSRLMNQSQIHKRALPDYLFVGIQLFIFALFPFRLIDFTLPFADILEIPAAILIGGGIAVTILAIIHLNFNISIFPTPKKEGVLIQGGIYKYIRHPIYTGVLMLAFGWSFLYASGYQFLLTLILTGLFYLKSRYEEEKLLARFPDYAQYKNQTGMFLP
jgi:protein-S-isoprenylcysteine O-methyltransferase Ste14